VKNRDYNIFGGQKMNKKNTFQLRVEIDRKIFRQLRLVMTRAERLWLLDCDGDYYLYSIRLRQLARDYKIEIPEG